MAEGVHSRRLAAILAADVVDYSRLMHEDEDATITAWQSVRRDIIDPIIAERDGRIVKHTGDGFLAEFSTVLSAVACAADLQKRLVETQLDFRMGVNLGDIVDDGEDIHGDGVNIAARLEGLADSGGICISSDVYNQVHNKLSLTYEDIGEQNVKNIAHPIHTYRVVLEKPAITPLALPDKPSIAVLPFDNMSGDPDQDFICDGLTEDIIAGLSRIHSLFVIARNSTFQYKGTSPDIRQVAEDLGVRYVLEGSVRKAGDRIRVTAQLIDAANNNHLWAERFDRDFTDIFAVQDEITGSIVAQLEPELGRAEYERTKMDPPENLDAWQLVTHALSHYGKMTIIESEAAIAILSDAVKKYPDYGPAHSLLAFSLLFSGHVGWILENDDYGDAEMLAQRAVEIDNQNPWSHLATGYLSFTKRNTQEAVRKYKRAIELNPNFAIAYGYMGWALAFDGQSDEAIEFFARALRMSPHDPLGAFFYSGTGVAHYCAQRYEEAAEWSKNAINERPGFTAAYRVLCASLAQAGNIKEAQEMLDRLTKMQPNVSLSWIEQHVPYTEKTMPHFLDGMRMAGLK